jgi:hypothetical protein
MKKHFKVHQRQQVRQPLHPHNHQLLACDLSYPQSPLRWSLGPLVM